MQALVSGAQRGGTLSDFYLADWLPNLATRVKLLEPNREYKPVLSDNPHLIAGNRLVLGSS
jgi:hypothetical protein